MKIVFIILLIGKLLFTHAYATPLDEAKKAVRIRDYTTAYTLLLPLAESGDKEAQFKLAALYRTCHGIDADYTQAFDWLLKSAQQEHVKAQYTVANMYENGLGTDRDLEQALTWYTKAADSGHSLAKTWIKSQTETPPLEKKGNIQNY